MAPYVPSPLEAKHYYYGLPSRPRLVARSSSHLWLEPTGPEAYLIPKELAPVGPHRLNLVWETTVGPAIVAYLETNDVECTSPDPVRIGTADDIPPPVVLWIGVKPSSLSHQAGFDIALHCKSVLSSNGVQDIEVEIRESEVVPAAKPYLPVPILDSTAEVREPFSTTLGIPICAKDTPHIQGTAAFFFTDSVNHNAKLFLPTARHGLFHPAGDNEFYKYDNPSQPKKEVCLLSDAAFKDRIETIKSKIWGKEIIIEYLTSELEAAEELTDQEASNREKEETAAELEKEENTIKKLKDLLEVVQADWKDLADRVIGHVVLSPPITFDAGDEGYTEDWAVIEVDTTKIDRSNFVGNTIDLRAELPLGKLIDWMSPNPGGPRFKFPLGGLLRFSGTISDDKMWKLNTEITDKNSDATIMVLKRGSTSGLTVGRLNTIRSFTRQYFEDQPNETSKEVAVLPRSFKSGPFHERGPFSEPGDSGSSILNGEGNVAGIITSGAGADDTLDVTYLASVTFILTRLALHGFKAHIFPSVDDLAV